MQVSCCRPGAGLHKTAHNRYSVGIAADDSPFGNFGSSDWGLAPSTVLSARTSCDISFEAWISRPLVEFSALPRFSSGRCRRISGKSAPEVVGQMCAIDQLEH